MAVNSIGDMAQTFMLRRLTTSLKQDANIAAQELTTGYSANIGRKLGGDVTRLTGLEATLSRLNGYGVVTKASSIAATSMQLVLGQIDSLTDGLGMSFLNASNMENQRIYEGLVSDGADRFEQVIATLNMRTGDRTILAGVASDGPAIAGGDVILSALEMAVTSAGAVTAVDIETAVTDWFNAPVGFANVGYLGGAAAGPVSISGDGKIKLDLTAADPALRDTLMSLAMVALVDRGTVLPDAETGRKLVKSAGAGLLQNQSDRTYLAGKLGVAQARIEQAQTRNEAEKTTLQLARSDLIAVDPYDAATRMEAAQHQLEALYSITARLSRLSLVDFLR